MSEPVVRLCVRWQFCGPIRGLLALRRPGGGPADPAFRTTALPELTTHNWSERP